jgi:NUMOD4 motif/NUMOD1 domain
MKGEKWKDISGFEDYYQASNYGRIKSLDREVPHPRLYKQFVRGQILSQSIARNKNILTGEASIDLRVTLAKDNVQYYFNTRRLIYCTFIRKIDYGKDGLYVINKNGDGFDCSARNLQLITKSEKQNRAIARGRIDFSILKTIDRSTWKKNYSRRKPIDQYDLKGNLIGKYKSIKEASEKTGFGEKEIISVAKGKYLQWRGFRWYYTKK